MHALVTKRKGLSIKSRMLILTSKARLLYFDPQGTYKGAVPWSVTKPIATHLVRMFSFFAIFLLEKLALNLLNVPLLPSRISHICVFSTPRVNR